MLVGSDEEHRDGVLGIGLGGEVEGQLGEEPGAKETRQYRGDEGADGRKFFGADRQSDQDEGREEPERKAQLDHQHSPVREVDVTQE